MHEIAYFRFPVCLWRKNGASMVARTSSNMSQKSTRERTADPAPSPKWPKDTPKSRSQHSGRVGRQSYARFKAEIELHNIRTTTEHDSQPPTVHFGFLCPAAATCARIDPENPPHRFARWIKRVQGGSRILGLLMSRSIFNAPYRQLPQARCLVDCPFQKLGSRMDAPIFVFNRYMKFHTFGPHFNR